MTRRFELPTLEQRAATEMATQNKAEQTQPLPPIAQELPVLSPEQLTADFLETVSRAGKEIDELVVTLNALKSEGLGNPSNVILYREAYSQLTQIGDRLSMLHSDMGKLIADSDQGEAGRHFAKQALQVAREELEEISRKLADAEKRFRPEQGLSAARAMHRTVRAAYASARERLSDDQRREFRGHIAELASAVREAEEAEYRRLFPSVPRKKSLEQVLKGYRQHATFAVARAERSADALTDALAAAIKAR